MVQFLPFLANTPIMRIRHLNQHITYTETEIQPQFHDLDPLNIVWHGNYVRYLETARCKLLRQIGYDYPQMKASGFAWPVVDMRIKYIRPALYGMTLVVSCAIIEWEHRLKIHYELRDRDSGQIINRAYTIQVAVDMRTEEMCYQSPPILEQCLKPYLQGTP